MASISSYRVDISNDGGTRDSKRGWNTVSPDPLILQAVGSLGKNTSVSPDAICNDPYPGQTPLSLFGFRASKTVTRCPDRRPAIPGASKESLPIRAFPPLTHPVPVTLWRYRRRKKLAQGNGIVLRFWSEPIVTNNGGHVRHRRGKDR